MKTYICAAKRTPIGSFQGSLANFSATKLGSLSIQATLKELALNSKSIDHLIDEVYMGCVLTAGLGQAPARQASLAAGIPNHVPCTTISKVCGSGLKAVMLADQSIRAGNASAVIAGGMESMSNSPYLIPKIRQGLRLGNGELIDSMIKDGLWDVYNDYHMGNAAELLNREHTITREAQDAYAAQSYTKAQNSISKGLFKNEISSITLEGRKESKLFDTDEEPAKSDLSKFPSLKPVFDKNGSVTAANASTLNDGAASMLVCSEEFASKNNLKPMAQIVAQAQAAQKPEWFTTAPAASIEKLLKLANLSSDQIDFWEINEAFSSVAIANMNILKLDPSKVNVRGGAVALGHPIGASGARILTTLCHTLKQEKKRYGVASLCLGGGEAVSLLIENIN